MQINKQGKRKAYKGIAMEGVIAKQYNRIQKHMIGEHKTWAKLVSDNTAIGGNVLEVLQVQDTCQLNSQSLVTITYLD